MLEKDGDAVKAPVSPFGVAPYWRKHHNDVVDAPLAPNPSGMCKRFTNTSGSCNWTVSSAGGGGSDDSICFEVSDSIEIVGFGMYSGNDQYMVEIKIFGGASGGKRG